MFFTEFSPLFQEFITQPIAFAGGFVSGVLRLKLSDDPVKTWLANQAGFTMPVEADPQQNGHGSGHGPQNIAID
jgi:hypothetical protein